MDLALFIVDPEIEKPIAIPAGGHIPFLQAFPGGSYTHIIVKNISSSILSNISLLIDHSLSSDYQIYSCISHRGDKPLLSAFDTLITKDKTTDALLEELHPGEELHLHCQIINDTPKIKIDYNDFSLVFSYDRSLISLKDMAVHLEFSDPRPDAGINTYEIEDSIDNALAIVANGETNNNVIQGHGRAFFTDSNDEVHITIPE